MNKLMREWTKSLGVTRETLAERTQLDQRTWGRIFRGDIKLTWKHIMLWCEAVNVGEDNLVSVWAHRKEGEAMQIE